jgi:hypothetical protein
MSKSAVFHVGLPKTGTTTVQLYLRSHESRLRRVGVLYPGSQEHPAMGHFKHLMILSAMLGTDPPKSGGLDAARCRRIVDRVFRKFAKSDHDCLLWSHEGISTRASDIDADYMRRLVNGLEVRVVLSVRYIDDWIESLYKERIRARGGRGRGRTERAEPTTKAKPLPTIGRRPQGEARWPRSMLEEASEIPGALRILQEIFPTSKIVVQSYDASREKGMVVAGALEAMGLPVASAFPDADKEAAVRNPTKSDVYSMLVYHLLMGRTDADVVRAITQATKFRVRGGADFQPLSGRRFRFLTEENIIEARGYYEELRRDFPHLPAQRPYAPDPAERSLPREDGVALLDWLRPDISDHVYERALAAYGLN